MQDPNPMPWGAQDRFQAHFVVRKTNYDNTLDYTARTLVSTSGHFSSKKVIGVRWDGGKLAKILDDDSSLNEMIVNQSPQDATIFVDPTENGIRIYGKWKDSFRFGITKDRFDIYDKIAGHIKSI